ncbi:MAG: hypothetical protein DRI83_04950, partial [Bacteroidetes bacterium]
MNHDTIDHLRPKVGLQLKLPGYKKHIKGIADSLLALIALFLLLPLLLPVSIILFLTGEHSVIYRQVRIGHRNNTFRIWKFATMRKGSSKMGAGSLTLRNDSRVLPVGKYLRMTKINELPEKLNLSQQNMIKENLKVFLERKLRELKVEIFRIRSKYGISSVEEFEELYKRGEIEEKNTWQDLQRLDHL